MTDLSRYRINVTGYRADAADAIEQIIDRYFIDLAYVDEIGPNFVLIVGDVDFQKPDDFPSLIEAIDQALRRYWVYAKFELILLPGEEA